jgi:hypothetical protein
LRFVLAHDVERQHCRFKQAFVRAAGRVVKVSAIRRCRRAFGKHDELDRRRLERLAHFVIVHAVNPHRDVDLQSVNSTVAVSLMVWTLVSVMVLP